MGESNANNSHEEITALKKIVKGAGIFFIGIIISKFITYFTRIFIARYFGPEEYGLFSLGLAVIGLFSIFGISGIQAGIARYIPYYAAKDDESRVKGVLVFSIVFVALLSSLVGGVTFLASSQIAVQFFHNPELKNVLMVLAISIPFTSLFSILTSSFEGFQKIEYRVYTEKIALNVLKLIFIVLFEVYGYGILGIVLAYTLATFLTFFIALYLLETKIFSLRTTLQSKYIKRELLIFSLPLVVSGFIKTMESEIDILMLGYFMSVREVGIYNAVIPTAQTLTFTAIAISVLFLPVVTELYAKGQKEPLEAVYKTVTKWVVYVSLPLLLIMVFFPAHVMNLLFGHEYIGGSMALQILAIGFFMRALLSLPLSLILVIKKSNLVFLIFLTSSLISIMLNLILIPLYGITGAAMAMASTNIIHSLITFMYVWHAMKISPFSKSLIRAVPSGLLSISAVYFGGKLIFRSFNAYSLLLLSVLFLCLYLISLLIWNGLQKEDVEILKAIEKKTGIRNEPLRRIIKKFVK